MLIPGCASEPRPPALRPPAPCLPDTSRLPPPTCVCAPVCPSVRQWLVWHEPFAAAACGGDDYFRYTSAAARSLAEEAGLLVEWGEADGGYATVLCETAGLHAADVCAQATGVPLDTRGGFYLASAMLARLKPQTLIGRLRAALTRGRRGRRRAR